MAVSRWLKNPDKQVFRLFGYAGTGKTTLAREFASGVEGSVFFGAYTGKAAYVLRQKGCPGAQTIHSMIYQSMEKGKARLRELENALIQLQAELVSSGLPKEKLEDHQRVIDMQKMLSEERQNLSRPYFSLNPESPIRHAQLVIIDECSMVDDQMGADLLSFKSKVLVLGDPFQLPPIGGAGYFTERVQPDVLLTDVRRQARDSPIIELATKTRNMEKLSIGSYGGSSVVNNGDLPRDEAQRMAIEADQILVGKNATRHASNRRMRSILGRSGDPQPGDRLVCLRNNNELGLLNGGIWSCTDFGRISEDRATLSVLPEDEGLELTCEAHTHHFEGRGDDLPWYERKEAEEFDYGYALTVHKSQGSQWNKVMLYDESWIFRQDRYRWLYTGITRAAENITVVRL
jgi:exodeoxyribonuclease-5